MFASLEKAFKTDLWWQVCLLASPDFGPCQMSWQLQSLRPERQTEKDRFSSVLEAISQIPDGLIIHLYEFFFWHCYREFEMTEAAGDHRAQLEVKTL